MIFAFLILSSLFGVVDADGWASVERPQKNSFEEIIHEKDSSIWVVFVKDLGAEKFLVRFPEDPQYTYLTPDEMEISSGNHRLRVLKLDPQFLEKRKQQLGDLLIEESQPAPNTFDLFYQSEGKWIWERIYLSSQHLYFLQTTREDPLFEDHQKFIHSLDIQ